MRKFYFFILLLATTWSALAQPQPLTPRQRYDSLFVNVQLQSVFPDGKTFVDCIPLSDPDSILSRYRLLRKDTAFGLKAFVRKNFLLPAAAPANYKTDTTESVARHINELWDVLRRDPDKESPPYSSLLPLPYPYIVPGGRFREIYYWDSYFTMLGLKESGRQDMLENMVRNFAFLINKYGFIPNGNRSYYLTRSQPPFFSLMLDLLAGIKGSYVYAVYQPALLKEYAFWMRDADSLQEGAARKNIVNIGTAVLNRYWDDSNLPREESFKADVEAAERSAEPAAVFYRNIRAAAESGWDFSSRWFEDGSRLASIRTTHIVPVDLNCLLYHLEQTIATSYEVSGNPIMEKIYQAKAEKRKEVIVKYCWNPSIQCFADYWYKERKVSNSITAACLFPLFFRLATPEQAEAVRKAVQDKLLNPGGIVTTVKNTGQQWDAPNGWAPLEYIAVEGLKNYGFQEMARDIATRWIRLNIRVYKNTGKLMEKYNVEDTSLKAGGGEYDLQDGFGWTNGVLLKLMHEYPDAAK